MNGVNGVALCGDKSAFKNIFQFSDISRPGMLHELSHCACSYCFDIPVEIFIEDGDKVLYQKRDILDSLPQRRDMDGNHVQPVEEFYPIFALVDFGMNILVGGRNNLDIQINRLVASDPLKLFLLKYTEQLHLHSGRYVANFVQKDGAPLGIFKFTDLGAGCTSKCSLFVTEQLGFQQGFGQRTTIYADKRSVFSGAVEMDSFGDQFLADTGFAGNKHPGIGGGDFLYQIVDDLHFMIFTDNITKGIALTDFFSQASNFLKHSSFPNCLFNGHQQALGFKRFLNIVCHTLFDGIDSR